MKVPILRLTYETANNKTNNMKHTLLKLAIASLLTFPFSGHAQGWNFGVEAGYVNK